MVDANPSKISKRFFLCFIVQPSLVPRLLPPVPSPLGGRGLGTRLGSAKIDLVEWVRDYLLVVENKEIAATWVQDRPLLLPDTDCIQLQYNKVLRVPNNTSEVCIIIVNYLLHHTLITAP